MYLYIGSNGHVAAFDPVSGEEVWRVELQAGIFGSTVASDVCVLEHEGRVFVGSSGHLYALDGETGDLLWHNDLKGLGHNDVTLSIAGKSIQVVATERKS